MTTLLCDVSPQSANRRPISCFRQSLRCPPACAGDTIDGMNVSSHPVPVLQRVMAVVRRIIGVPDYDTYLAHMQRHHPECTPLDPRTFERERMADRYSRPGSRCC